MEEKGVCVGRGGVNGFEALDIERLVRELVERYGSSGVKRG